MYISKFKMGLKVDDYFLSRYLGPLGVFFFVIILSYCLMLNPLVKDYQFLDLQEQSLKESLIKSQISFSLLPSYQQHVANLGGQVAQYSQFLIKKNEFRAVIDLLLQLKKECGLSLEFFTPLATRSQDFYQVKPIELALLGSYHQLRLFLSRLVALKVFIDIEDFEFAILNNKQASTKDLLHLFLTIKIYQNQESSYEPIL